jgi:regulator of RNase E activity RraA
VFASPPQIEADLIAAFAKLDLVNVADAMHGMGSMDGRIEPIWRPVPRVIGTALTVCVTPGNGQMIRRAILMGRPGDVMVINAFGTEERAVLGGSVIADVRANEIAAVIVDGAVRDRGEIATQRVPVFARALTTRAGTDTKGRGEINAPIACGSVVVCPGELVLADDEGVVVVPRLDVQLVHDSALAVQARMGSVRELEGRLDEARRGRVRGYDVVAEALQTGGCAEFGQTWERRAT